MVTKVRKTAPMTGAYLVDEVSTKDEIVISSGKSLDFRVAAFDLGIKAATPANFSRRGIETHVLPFDTKFEEIESQGFDGIFLSNGPGDPSTMNETVETIRKALSAGMPIFGICFGHQILGRALGFDTYKLRFGHRGINQPVYNRIKDRVEITAHNHGFAVDAPIDGDFATVFGGGMVSHTNLNDGVVEGIFMKDVPAFSVQYHPEAAGGPHDANYLFDDFLEILRKNA
jgi:carbamoyl-phosphate synthase small subunit